MFINLKTGRQRARTVLPLPSNLLKSWLPSQLPFTSQSTELNLDYMNVIILTASFLTDRYIEVRPQMRKKWLSCLLNYTQHCHEVGEILGTVLPELK
jgi:hypothetical protein